MRLQTLKMMRFARICFATACLGLVFFIGIDKGIFSAFSGSQPQEHFEISINEVMALNRGLIQAGDGGFYGYVELYNGSDKEVNLKGFGLSNDAKNPFRWVFPSLQIEPYSYITIWTSCKDKLIDSKSAHANFKLNASSNLLVLTSPTRSWRTALLFEKMYENISYGRQPDGSGALYWFDGCTAGGPNTAAPLEGSTRGQRLAPPVFNMPAGFYEDAVVLELSCNDDAQIHFTLDGSEPEKESPLYKEPLYLARRDEPYIVRARAFKAGHPKSGIVTRTYFVEEGILERYDIPVVSLSTSPSNLFDYETGIYVAGKLRNEWLATHPEAVNGPSLPANYNQKGKLWERPAHIEFFSPAGEICISQGIGMRTHGGYSLEHANKSLRLLANADYDEKELFEYDFFNDGAEYIPLNGIILRNSATDSRSALFRDAFIQSLADPNRLDVQASQPCIAFINGIFYGIYNIRPLYNAEYLAHKYSFSAEDVVIIKNPTGGIGDEVQEGFAGDEAPYNKLFTFIKSSDMRKPDNYAYVKTQIDIDNYIEYNILEIYCGNIDWLANNVRIWRKRTQAYAPQAPYGQDGRWRWLVYDLDSSYGLFYKSYEEDSMAAATAMGSDKWYNTDEFTVMLRALLTNEEFRTKFITRFADLLNTAYGGQTALARLNAMLTMYLPYVPKHLERWNLHKGDMSLYLEEINRMREYAVNRPEAVRKHIMDYFELSDVHELQVSITGKGAISLNTLSLDAQHLPFSGYYYVGIPVMLTAIPAEGFRFTGWEGSIVSQSTQLTVNPIAPVQLHAVFVPAS